MDYFKSTLTEAQLREMSSLGLAHIGDAVYELMARVHTVHSGRREAAGMHRAAVSYVNAGKQAENARRLEAKLNAQELAVYRRGRNAKVKTVPKGAVGGDYHAATGLEALFGYLYLKGETERLNELFSECVREGE